MSNVQASDDELANVAPEIAALLPASTARRLRAVPIALTADDPPRLRVAMRDPDDAAAVHQLRTLSGHPIAPVPASSMQLGRALDHLYSAMAAAPAPMPARETTPPAPRGAWKRTALPDGHEEEGMLHDGSNTWLRYVVGAVVTGALLIAGRYLYVTRKQEARQDKRDGHLGERVSGHIDAPELGVSLDLGDGYWRWKGDNELGIMFTRFGQSGFELGNLRVHRMVGEGSDDVARMDELAVGGTFGDGDCYETQQLPGVGLACERGRTAGWFWNDDGDAIRVIYHHDNIDTIDVAPIERIVHTIRTH